MPRVPVYEQRVAVRDLPNARFQSNANLEAFGGGQSQAEVTRAGVQLSQTVSKIGELITEEADTAIVNDATAKLLRAKQDALYDPQNGALTRRGQNAFNIVNEYGSQYEKTAADITSKLNARQRAKLQPTVEREGLQMRDMLQRHMFRESQQYADSADTSAITALQNEMALDPSLSQDRLAEIQDKVLMMAHRNGLGPEETKVLYQKTTSGSHVGVIRSMLANQNDMAAEHYYKTITSEESPGMVQKGNISLETRPYVKNADGTVSTFLSMSANFDGKEVLFPRVSDDGRIMSEKEAIAEYKKTGKHLGIFNTPQEATAHADKLHNIPYIETEPGKGTRVQSITAEDKVKIQGWLEEGSRRGFADRKAKEWDAKGVTVETLQDELDKISDPAKADAAKSRFVERLKLKDAAKEAEQARLVNGAYQTAMQALDRYAVPPDVWDSLPRNVQKDIELQVAQKRDGVPFATNWKTWTALNEMSMEYPKKFLDINPNMMRRHLDDEHYEKFLNMRKEISKTGKSSDADDFRTFDTIFTKTMSEYGMDTKDMSAAQYNAISERVAQEQRTRQGLLGRKLNETEFQKMLDDLLVKADTGWFSSKRVHELSPGDTFDIDIDEIPERIKTKLRADITRGGGIVTDDEIKRQYLKQRGVNNAP